MPQQHARLRGQRANHKNFRAGRFQGQHAIVLQQHHGLVGQFKGQRTVRQTVQLTFVDVVVRNHGGGIEHAQLHAGRKLPHQRRIEIGHLQVALLDRLDVRLVIVIVQDLVAEIDALVVHAARTLMATACTTLGS